MALVQVEAYLDRKKVFFNQSLFKARTVGQ